MGKKPSLGRKPKMTVINELIDEGKDFVQKQDVAEQIPVSLTSILVKCLESIIHKHIMKFLTHHRLLSESQHGFREVYK